MKGNQMKATLGDYFPNDGLGTNFSGMPFYDAWNLARVSGLGELQQTGEGLGRLAGGLVRAGCESAQVVERLRWRVHFNTSVRIGCGFPESVGMLFGSTAAGLRLPCILLS